MAAYRAEATIAASVRSVLAQDFQNWELVIVSDDGVDYEAMLSDAGAGDARIRFCSTGMVGAGAARARNVGLEAATQRFVTALDADDRYVPSRLGRLVPMAEQHGLANSGVVCVSDKGTALLEIGCEGESGVVEAAGYLRRQYSSQTGLVADRKRFPEGWPLQEPWEDYGFLLNCFQQQSWLYYVAEPLLLYTKQAVSASSGGQAVERLLRLKVRWLDELRGNDAWLDPPLRDVFLAFLECSLQAEKAYAADPSLIFEQHLQVALASTRSD